MLDQWIERCTLQRVSLHEGLVLSFEDYNEVVISRPLRLGLPPVGPYPAEVVVLDPLNIAPAHRALLDLAGSMCVRAHSDDDGALHLQFSDGHSIDVEPDAHVAAWELYGKRHGYMACMPGGQVRMVRHDLPAADNADYDTAPASP
ncbi:MULTISPECIES: DUF6188 family protein [Mycobacteriaceae]|jgi:hypothetical protein|uniref:DUF6188 family protein n=1 Tax=Mycolicibacterium TaxID=1866885 RepID=UPI000769B7EB|nr:MULTISPECIES: DUF6188 family protein [Mycolicibacterium]MBN9636555.1 hypothetical protein [Actinomycetota bacterium]MCT7365091.1 hypothetical protein [Mycolicibacterium llatzerense]MCT7372882.1 hypothetical protein [Mycolicibacterium llatzerense]MCX8562498.1 DUF6188 family protein [Mycolicibacterium mucogenicum]RUP26615.1 MAG: hypothetical protein EKK51_29610 [Mycolicibacterium sp.]